MKAFVSVMRKWKEPKIEIIVTDGIELKMDLDDFVSILKTELGSFYARKSSLETDIDSAVAKIIGAVKEESKKAI